MNLLRLSPGNIEHMQPADILLAVVGLMFVRKCYKQTSKKTIRISYTTVINS